MSFHQYDRVGVLHKKLLDLGRRFQQIHHCSAGFKTEGAAFANTVTAGVHHTDVRLLRADMLANPFSLRFIGLARCKLGHDDAQYYYVQHNIGTTQASQRATRVPIAPGHADPDAAGDHYSSQEENW